MTGAIPAPSCPTGYTNDDLDAILGDRRPAFARWMAGQTVSLCDGRTFNYTTRRYEPSECADHPHGAVTYGADLRAFLDGRQSRG